MDYPYDLGRYGRPVSTHSGTAQHWFDRGLVWTYGYNHAEAVACFRRALEADPDCAMAAWGAAYALGPNYNLPWHLYDRASRRAALAEAHAMAERARAALAKRGGTRAERALIGALAARYPAPEPLDDMAPWDRAFAEAMAAAREAFPGDLDLRAIHAEALLVLTPWKMWDLETGAPAEGAETLAAKASLEDAFALDPAAWDHPGCLHLYIHLMEMSPTPETALRQGDRLRGLVPDAGHLVHMPTHIDVQCGDYAQTLATNQAAIRADRLYLTREGAFSLYTGYRQHNYHFAVYGAMMLGQMAPALAAAEELIETTPEAFLRVASPPMADYFESYLALRYHVLVRFGAWAEILETPAPADPVLYANLTATHHYARTLALALTDQAEAAEAEAARFRAAAAAVPEGRRLHNNRCRDLLAVADAMVEGELAYRRGETAAGLAALRRAVALEDALPYDEPWGWMQPTRHALGALLLEAGDAAAAATVFRADLGLDGALPRARVHADTVWALRGLADCLTALGEADGREAAEINRRLALAEARADRPIRAACFCARSA